MKMSSCRPYLIRAFYEWIVENNLTPHIAVDAEMPGVQVPQEFVKDGRIVLNISEAACQGLLIQSDRIVFSARFGGLPVQVSFPPIAVLAIYARENGRGMIFDPNDDDDDGDSTGSPRSTSKDKTRPRLTVVK